MSRLTLLPAADRLMRPWKNGGGLTCEIDAWPPGSGLDGFDWRLSLAVVEAAGPFSRFVEIDRLMLVLDGALELEIAGAGRVRADSASEALAFPGEAATVALAPSAPVSDVNLMVRRGRYAGSLERRRIKGAATVICQDITFVISREGGLAAGLRSEQIELGTGDALRVEEARGAMLRLRPAGEDEVVVAHVNAVRGGSTGDPHSLHR